MTSELYRAYSKNLTREDNVRIDEEVRMTQKAFVKGLRNFRLGKNFAYYCYREIKNFKLTFDLFSALEGRDFIECQRISFYMSADLQEIRELKNRRKVQQHLESCYKLQ